MGRRRPRQAAISAGVGRRARRGSASWTTGRGGQPRRARRCAGAASSGSAWGRAALRPTLGLERLGAMQAAGDAGQGSVVSPTLGGAKQEVTKSGSVKARRRIGVAAAAVLDELADEAEEAPAPAGNVGQERSAGRVGHRTQPEHRGEQRMSREIPQRTPSSDCERRGAIGCVARGHVQRDMRGRFQATIAIRLDGVASACSRT